MHLENSNRPQLPEGYNKVLNLLGKNLDFLEYFANIGTVTQTFYLSQKIKLQDKFTLV